MRRIYQDEYPSKSLQTLSRVANSKLQVGPPQLAPHSDLGTTSPKKYEKKRAWNRDKNVSSRLWTESITHFVNRPRPIQTVLCQLSPDGTGLGTQRFLFEPHPTFRALVRKLSTPLVCSSWRFRFRISPAGDRSRSWPFLSERKTQKSLHQIAKAKAKQE